MTNLGISPSEARKRQQSGDLLIDVRSDDERSLGMAEGTAGVVLEALLQNPSRYIQGLETPVMLLCQSGVRSDRCAETLKTLGYMDVVSVEGGIDAWHALGLPMRGTQFDAEYAERYSRQIRLPDVGLEGQRRLGQARVLVLGAGGLGSPVALYLAAAGVGMLRIVDDDRVDRSNLQRQILHTDARIGMAKVESAAATLLAINPRTRIEALEERAMPGNLDRLLDGIDVVVDGSDNFQTRYLLNDACVRLGMPLVYGAVQRFHGQASVFDAGRNRGRLPCYRCLYPRPPEAGSTPNCAEAGVLGVLPGVIGMLQATETIKLILGIGETLAGRLLQFDALRLRFSELRITPDPGCPVCSGNSASL